MQTLFANFKRLELNERALTEADFYRICRREKIKVEDLPLSVRGFYGVCKGKRFIALDSRLRGMPRLFTAFHELAHHFLHAPKATASVNFFHLREDPKVKLEADTFAAVALLPEPLLRKILADGGDFDEHGFTREMVTFRLKVLDLYGV
jgi:Zn-dependent peptidase ImmA (M78 family)